MFDHECLDVYKLALDFVVLANDIAEGLPRGRGHFSDQLARASTSILLNIAEGAGRLSKPEKRRFYLIARGSATESSALLDACLRLKLLEERTYTCGREMLLRIVSMLIRLSKACEP